MEAIDQLATALAAAQAEMPTATFNRVNPHFKSQYADLSAVRAASIPSLAKHGLSITQFKQVREAGFVLVTRLMHKSGQFIDDEFPIPMGTPQQMGSAMTYGRRYGWSGLTGLAADEDDDANAAEGLQVKPGAKAKPKADARKDYQKIEAAFREAQTEAELIHASTVHADAVASLPDDWKNNARAEYARCLTKLRLDDEVPEGGGSEVKEEADAAA